MTKERFKDQKGKGKTITLNPVSFKDAVAAALETPPERNLKKSANRKNQKPAKEGGLGESGS